VIVLIDGDVASFKCSKCKEVKDYNHFHKDSSGPRGYAYYCKSCANTSARHHHNKKAKDKEWINTRRRTTNEKHRQAKLKAIQYLGGQYYDCKKEYPSYVYDFHHVDGSTKLDNPSRVLRGDWESAKVELDKCVLLCSNCHRGRHFSDSSID